MQKTVLGALTALQDDFVQFKDHYQSQVDHIHHLEPTWRKQMSDIQDSLQTTKERLSKMEIALKRPVLGQTSSALPMDHQAFTHFIRKGFDGLEIEHKAMISQNDSQGGYLVPPMMAELIENKLKSLSPLRQLARCTKISGNSLDLLIEKGEAEVGWVAETDERHETQTPEFAKLRLPVHQIYAKPKISQVLLDDASFDMENWLVEKIAQKMAGVENQAFLFGNGETKPRGILNYPVVSLGQGQWGKWEAAVIQGNELKTADCFIDVFHGLKAQYLPGSAWLMSRPMARQIRQLKDLQGQYLWQPSLSQDNPNTLMGYPVYFSDELMDEQQGKQEGKEKKGEKESKLNSKTVIFGNFHEAYQIVDRSHLHVLRDPFSAKPYVEFYTTKRVGGDVINFDALKLIQLAGN